MILLQQASPVGGGDVLLGVCDTARTVLKRTLTAKISFHSDHVKAALGERLRENNSHLTENIPWIFKRSRRV